MSSTFNFVSLLLIGVTTKCWMQNGQIWVFLSSRVTEWTDPDEIRHGRVQQLHWLPVKWRIQFKLASITYKVIHTGTLHICLNASIPTYVSSRSLRWSSANLYVPRTNLHFGSCSFYIAAPTVWNSLPTTFRSSQTLNTFQKHLKTHLFQSAFNSPLQLVQRLWFILLNDHGA